MALPTVYDICVPRDDVLQGSITESDFAADLAQILRGDAPEEYTDPVKFFANTYPTRGAEGLTGQCLPSLRFQQQAAEYLQGKIGNIAISHL
jgi:hypothetical protein